MAEILPDSGGADSARQHQVFSDRRQEMVRTQLTGPGRNITNQAVLKAMASVPRHEFIPEGKRDEAYADHPLPIGYGQTISQPYIVAFMTESLRPQPGDCVLEIGAGSGYQAAILAQLVQTVYSVEIVEPLARQAQATLQRLAITNVFIKAGDGHQGWREHAPYDAIIVTCSPDHIPPPLLEQLRDGGRMIIPVANFFGQELVLLEKQGHEIRQRQVLPVRFVPMTCSADGKPRKE